MNNKKGLALFVVVILGLILAITGIAFLYMSREERLFSHKGIYPTSAFWIAEAGVEHGKAWLEKEVHTTYVPPTGEAFQPFEEQQFGRGKYDVTIIPPSSSNRDGYKIISVASVDTNTRAGTVTVKKQINLNVVIKSFARYAYFTNSELGEGGETIWFTGNDVLYGPVHSNSRINIRGRPVFHGKVTSTANSFNYYSGVYNNPDFRAGYQLGVQPIDMNKYLNMDKLKTASNASGGIHIASDSTITLDGNTLAYTERYNTGRYDRTRTWTKIGNTLTTTYVEDYKDASGRWRTRTVTTSRTLTPSFNGVIYSNGDITIQGPGNADARVYDRLTIVAENDMIITDRIRYNLDPDDPGCTGQLGLVAGRSVEVDSSAPNNMVIHASIMVFDKSFYVENHNRGNPRGTLNVWGGIIQNYRGLTGTFNPSTGRLLTGFAKDYRYDDRATTDPPPFFPTVDEDLDIYFDVNRWEEINADSTIQ